MNGYDHRNRRVQKNVKRRVGGYWANAETHTFVWDGNNIVLKSGGSFYSDTCPRNSQQSTKIRLDKTLLYNIVNYRVAVVCKSKRTESDAFTFAIPDGVGAGRLGRGAEG